MGWLSGAAVGAGGLLTGGRVCGGGVGLAAGLQRTNRHATLTTAGQTVKCAVEANALTLAVAAAVAAAAAGEVVGEEHREAEGEEEGPSASPWACHLGDAQEEPVQFSEPLLCAACLGPFWGQSVA